MLDDITLSEKLAARVSWEAAAHLVDWYADHPPQFSPLALAFDLRRQFGDEGFDLWRELMAEHDPYEPWESHPETWNQFDYTEPRNSDYFLVDEMTRARASGWTIAPDVESVLEPHTLIAPAADATIEELAKISGARRAQQIAADEAADRAQQTAGDAEHTQWLASGEPDYIEEYRNRRNAAVAAWRAHCGESRVSDMDDFIKSSGEFVSGFVPPDFLIDGILQRRFCYSLTAQTGVGKTAVAMLLSALVSTGRQLGEISVEQGSVLYFAGENPTDIQTRWLGLTYALGIDPNEANVHFVPGARPLSHIAEAITAEIVRKGIAPSLVVVDTAAAYFEGEEENSNTQLGAFARQLRTLTLLPGGPCVLILCHPTKRATDDDLIPRGGGAFLAEVDGNIALVKRESVLVATAQGKFRGSDAWSLRFELDVIRDHPKLRDTRGRRIPTVIAKPISADSAAALEKSGERDEDVVLRATPTRSEPGMTATDIARKMGWFVKNDPKQPAHMKVTRILVRLKNAKMADEARARWRLTAKGEQELNQIDAAAVRPMPFPPPRGA